MNAEEEPWKAQMSAEENVAKGEAFRTDYTAAEGVEKTESGLLYKIVEAGEGESPARESTVVVHYAGRLIDGTEFDSTIARGEPATFTLTNLIPGWTEIVVQLMKPGAKYEVVIPPELAYSDRGAGDRITPNSTLVFDIELMEVKAAEMVEEMTEDSHADYSHAEVEEFAEEAVDSATEMASDSAEATEKAASQPDY